MKRLFLSIALLAVFILLPYNAYARNFVQLNKGALILVYPKKVLSTAALQEGDPVYFISPADIWVNETNIVPQNSVFIGYVSMLKMPVKGVNAAFSVKITQIITPDGMTKNFEGTLSNGSSDIFGGELTAPASYNKMAHPYLSRWRWSGSTQWVPSGDYEFGVHRSITPSTKVFIVLDEPYSVPERD